MKRLYLLATLAPLAACAAPVAPEGEPRPAAYVVSGPEVGQRAPGFTLEGATKDGPLTSAFDLTLQRGKVTVLAFYPRDFTSGCTAEFQTFRDRGTDIFGEGVTVVGISVDSVGSHVNFAQSIGHPYALLADTDLRVARLYGSASDQGYARRTVYVIGKDGKVAYRNLRFGALDPKAYDELQQAVAAAR
jgi:thioredoxin-dependent peroxiredoxin